MIVPCECGAKLKLDDAKIGNREARVRCPRCGNVLTVSREAAEPGPQAAFLAAVPSALPAGPAPLVLIAHDSDMVREMVSGILLDAGFHVDHAADGMEALAKVSTRSPRVVIIDVGLPGIYGYDLCDRLKTNPATSRIKIILLASVYGITRYKRMPTSLYGADDYIEKHHIADSLTTKIRRLLEDDGAPAPAEGPAAAGEREFDSAYFRPESLVGDEPGAEVRSGFSRSDADPSASPPGDRAGGDDHAGLPSWDGQALSPDSFSLESSIFEKEECNIPRVEENDPEAVEKAKRFARIIVSDIALYNQEAVMAGVRDGTFYELLKDDVEEGRRLYDMRVPEAIRAARDYYTETIENFIASQKKIVH